MNIKRRHTIKAGGGLALVAAAISAGVLPTSAFADWNKAAFEAKNMADVLKAMGGSTAEKSADIIITAPDIAENGAVVPVAVASKIANTQSISILVEKTRRALPQNLKFFPAPKPTSAPA